MVEKWGLRWILFLGGDPSYQREKLGTLGRAPEIYTNMYHLYMDYIMVVYRAIFLVILGGTPPLTQPPGMLGTRYCQHHLNDFDRLGSPREWGILERFEPWLQKDRAASAHDIYWFFSEDIPLNTRFVFDPFEKNLQRKWGVNAGEDTHFLEFQDRFLSRWIKELHMNQLEWIPADFLLLADVPIMGRQFLFHMFCLFHMLTYRYYNNPPLSSNIFLGAG